MRNKHMIDTCLMEDRRSLQRPFVKTSILKMDASRQYSPIRLRASCSLSGLLALASAHDVRV
jgi:hypothetical protein